MTLEIIPVLGNVIYQNIHALKGPSEEHSMMARELGFFISDLIVNTLATPIENGLSISQMSNNLALAEPLCQNQIL